LKSSPLTNALAYSRTKGKPTPKRILRQPKKLTGEKRSSLFCRGVSGDEKSFVIFSKALQHQPVKVGYLAADLFENVGETVLPNFSFERFPFREGAGGAVGGFDQARGCRSRRRKPRVLDSKRRRRRAGSFEIDLASNVDGNQRRLLKVDVRRRFKDVSHSQERFPQRRYENDGKCCRRDEQSRFQLSPAVVGRQTDWSPFRRHGKGNAAAFVRTTFVRIATLLT
jgi:hypothetical protein